MENMYLTTYSCSLITDDQRRFPPFVYKLFLPDAKAKVVEQACRWEALRSLRQAGQ